MDTRFATALTVAETRVACTAGGGTVRFFNMLPTPDEGPPKQHDRGKSGLAKMRLHRARKRAQTVQKQNFPAAASRRRYSIIHYLVRFSSHSHRHVPVQGCPCGARATRALVAGLLFVPEPEHLLFVPVPEHHFPGGIRTECLYCLR